MRTLRKILFATLIVAIASAAAMACDCVTGSDAENFEKADEVFIGKVIRIDYHSTTTFEVTRWAKGSERQLVNIDSNETNCDVSFFEGYTYIVYARKTEKQLFAGACSGTRLIQKPFAFEPKRLNTCDFYDRPNSYRYIALVTISSVFLSLTCGVLVSAIKRRFRK
jgi:hypothetical protein